MIKNLVEITLIWYGRLVVGLVVDGLSGKTGKHSTDRMKKYY